MFTQYFLRVKEYFSVGGRAFFTPHATPVFCRPTFSKREADSKVIKHSVNVITKKLILGLNEDIDDGKTALGSFSLGLFNAASLDSLSRLLQTALPSVLPGGTIEPQNTGVRCCVRRFFLANLKQEPERHVRRPAGNSF